MTIHTSELWELNAAELRALRMLSRLEKIWPKSLSIQAGASGGGIDIMKHGEDGQVVMIGNDRIGNARQDQDYICAHFHIAADGGDPW